MSSDAGRYSLVIFGEARLSSYLKFGEARPLGAQCSSAHGTTTRVPLKQSVVEGAVVEGVTRPINFSDNPMSGQLW